jgi:hypothetical protein
LADIREGTVKSVVIVEAQTEEVHRRSCAPLMEDERAISVGCDGELEMGVDET